MSTHLSEHVKRAATNLERNIDTILNKNKEKLPGAIRQYTGYDGDRISINNQPVQRQLSPLREAKLYEGVKRIN